MQLSTHYYILLLNKDSWRLFEAFRDTLIEIKNITFPFNLTKDSSTLLTLLKKDKALEDFFKKADTEFFNFYKEDPLKVVLVGDSQLLEVFQTSSISNYEIIGQCEFDYSTAPSTELGSIAWNLVKERLVKDNELTEDDLSSLINEKRFVSGITEVWKKIKKGEGQYLLLSEDYHVRGSIEEIDDEAVISTHVSLTDVFDDITDVIIELFLNTGGSVQFMDQKVLKDYNNIVLVTK